MATKVDVAGVQDSMNSDGTLKVSGVRQALDRAREATSVITLNGWVAVLSVACAVFLSFYGAMKLYRRYAGLEKPYTLLVPRGEDAASDGHR